MKMTKIAMAFGVLLLLMFTACETRSTTVVNDQKPDRVVVADTDPVVVQPTHTVVWYKPSTWTTSSSSTTTTTNTQTTQPAPQPAPAPEPTTTATTTTEPSTTTTTTSDSTSTA